MRGYSFVGPTSALGSPGTDVIQSNIFLPKYKILTLFFMTKANFSRRKFAKMAENVIITSTPESLFVLHTPKPT
jgi:hypothetical protein